MSAVTTRIVLEFRLHLAISAIFAKHTMFGVCDCNEGCGFNYFRFDDCLSLDLLFFFVKLQYHILAHPTSHAGFWNHLHYSVLASQLHSLDFLFSQILAHPHDEPESSQTSHQKHQKIYTRIARTHCHSLLSFSFPFSLFTSSDWILLQYPTSCRCFVFR
ncbi:hypothetical protein BJX96DRAFT_17093 [Aspergillus floccosus]